MKMAIPSPVLPSFVISSVWLLFAVLQTSTAQQATLPNVDHVYPVHIGAENHIVQGRISAEALTGSMVPSNVINEGDDDANVQVHLRVEVRDSIYKRPHVYHPDIKINTSDPGNPQFEHPVIEFTNSSLPYGMEFVVIGTNAFYVNEDRYICVNDFTDLDAETRIHFDVILKDRLAETHYVSNQLPFVVEIEYPVREPNPNAAFFAGVLILTIVAISLIIPFVVRAKRRSKAGKPICGCGSADDASDQDSLGSGPEFTRNRAMSIGGKDNLAMILDNGRMKHHRPSIDPHSTIGTHMLRSTSSMHFQPHWKDPHYNDVYDRPDFSSYTLAPPVTRMGNGISNGSFTRGMGINSNRSSASSLYNYPANFNKNFGPATGKGQLANGGATSDGIAKAANGEPKTANGGVSTVSNGYLNAPSVSVNGRQVVNGGASMRGSQTADIEAGAVGGASAGDDKAIRDENL